MEKDNVLYRAIVHLLKWILVPIILICLPIYWAILLIALTFISLLLVCTEWNTPKQKKLRLNKFMGVFGKITKIFHSSYTSNLWDDFQKNGYIECPISKYRFERDKLDNMNPQKLLNYLLQNLETATNVLILWDIFKILRGKNTKLVLYVYDSFLLDIDESETEILDEIKQIFKDKNLQIKIKKGVNYNFTQTDYA